MISRRSTSELRSLHLHFTSTSTSASTSASASASASTHTLPINKRSRQAGAVNHRSCGT